MILKFRAANLKGSQIFRFFDVVSSSFVVGGVVELTTSFVIELDEVELDDVADVVMMVSTGGGGGFDETFLFFGIFSFTRATHS